MSLEKVLRSRFPRYLGEGDTCTLTIDNVWVLPLELTLAFGANEDTTDNREAIVAALQECLLSISIHADIKLVSGSRSSKGLCYLIIFNETDAAVCAEQIHKLGFANGEVLQAVEVVSREEWGRKIAELYEKNALGRDALGEAEELIKKLKGLIGDADRASVPELKRRLYVAEKDLERITITNLYKTHMQTLQEYLETPLPPAAHANINAALHLLRAYDPIITDPNRDFSICFYQGRQVAALRGEQETLGSYRDELAEFLGVDSNEVQVWQELPLTFVINELADMDLIAGAAGHWNIVQRIKSPNDAAEANAQMYSFLLDCGATLPLGRPSDVTAIDPAGLLQQSGVVTSYTANGVDRRSFYDVDMRITTPGGVNITNWRRTRYLLGGAGQRRLSGLFPFQYAYLAKSPGNLIRIGNLKTLVAAGMMAGQGDD